MIVFLIVLNLHGHMNREREPRKRRTQSAADVELSSQLSSDIPEPSPLSQRPRRKSNARQARLIAFPQFYPNMPLQMHTQLHMSQPVFQQMNFNPTPVQMVPAPQVTKNSIIFTLIPQQRELSFNFQINLANITKVTVISATGLNALTFSMNSTLFRNVALPFDLTQNIINGNNIIQFCTYGLMRSIFVELKLEDQKDPEEILTKIINEYPAAPFVEQDLFPSNICPITQQVIDKAGRGVHCTHTQCFDLRAFIKRGLSTGNWECPICGQSIPLEELRYDRDYMRNDRFLLEGDDAVGQQPFGDIMAGYDPFDGGIDMYRDF